MTLQSTAPSVGNASFAVDPKEVDALRRSARQNSPDALKAVAQQFEGLFMNMIMKSMRDATPKEGLFDSEQGKMFSSMLDQQLSQNLAKRGVGLADMLIRQLSNNRGVPAEGGTGLPSDVQRELSAGNLNLGLVAASPMTAAPVTGPGANSFKTAMQTVGRQANAEPGFQANLQTALESGIPSVLKAALTGLRGAGKFAATTAANATNAANTVIAATDMRPRTASAAHVRAFEDKVGIHAQEASRTTGIPAKFMMGQAALESGWGKREIIAADGSNSHNLFGIKANSSWKGKVVETATTEYVNGMPERRIERFRAYDNYAEAFRDYAKLMQNNPRYQNVLANSQDVQGFAQGLQRAGYATDPQYAAKLTRIITHSLSG